MSGVVTRNGGRTPQPRRTNVLYDGERESSTHQSPQRSRTYRKRTPGFVATPYIVRPIGKVPIGVVPSPSRRLTRIPFQPTRAEYGPPAPIQHAPERRQI